MNRYFALILLLCLFISCGNSSRESIRSEYHDPRTPQIIEGLLEGEDIQGEKLDLFFNRLHSRGAFNGCVLVARAGRVIYRKSLGFLDKKRNIPLHDTAMFQLASVSKVLTATAVLILHERGEVNIEKPFAHYFPDFPYPNVTVKELLNHRSGLPNYIYCFNSEVCRTDYQMSNTDMYNHIVAKKPDPYLRPGRRFNYCNTNYALLPLLIEKISGKSYSQFMHDEIFEPLGMRHTATIQELDLSADNVTRPYDHRWKPVPFDASDYVLGDKSIYSTTYDLFLFSEALYQNRLISKKTQELAYTPYSKERKLSNYGIGWRLNNFNDPDRKEVYHNGWWHGYRTSFHRRLKDTLTVVILSNKLNSVAYQSGRVYQILDNSNEAQFASAEEQ